MHARFLAATTEYLEQVYVARLARALEVLPDRDLWWRPHDGSLAFGNILVHLEGNVRQWILSGIGGAADQRERSAEFAATSGPAGAALLDSLSETVREAVRVIRGLDPARLEDARTIQGQETTVLEALYHVVEHFSWHTGQAVWIAKARAGENHGLAFYDDSELDQARNTDNGV